MNPKGASIENSDILSKSLFPLPPKVKRIRFKVTDLPEEKRDLWKRLSEAAVLDYIQNGPDYSAGDGEGGCRRIDDRAVIEIIITRYAQIIGGVLVDALQKEVVLS